MKRLTRGFLLGIILIAGFMVSVFAADAKPDATCPVMPGRKVKEKFFVDYQGTRTYLCCASCVKAFKKNPEKYLEKQK